MRKFFQLLRQENHDILFDLLARHMSLWTEIYIPLSAPENVQNRRLPQVFFCRSAFRKCYFFIQERILGDQW
jgi:hypothetical protein